MVEVDAASNPIAGKVYLTAEELPFVGWLGLATALEQVLEEGGGLAADGQSMDPTERTEQ